MECPKLYTLAELETLRRAAKVLCSSETDSHSLDRLLLLSNAAELLGTTIDGLRQVLSAVGFSLTHGSPQVESRNNNSPSGMINIELPNLADATENLPNVSNVSAPPTTAVGLRGQESSCGEPSDTLLHFLCPDQFGQPSDVDYASTGAIGPWRGSHTDAHTAEFQDLDFEDIAAQCANDCFQLPHYPLWLNNDLCPTVPGNVHNTGSGNAQPNGMGVEAAASTIFPWTGSQTIQEQQPVTIAPKPTSSKTAVNVNAREYRGPVSAITDAGIRKQARTGSQVNACIRCRLQKLRCIPDPYDRHGPCLSCKQAAHSIYRLPCLRYRILNIPLFRHGMYNSPFYIDHPLVGDRYGDFYIRRAWVSSVTKVISALHHGGLRLEVEVKQFTPPLAENATDDRSVHGAVARPMYAIPWAVADPEIELRKLEPSVDRSIDLYLSQLLRRTDRLVWPVYQEAKRLMHEPHTEHLLLNTLRLWTGARLADRGWKCCGTERLGAEALENTLRPAGWTPLPPYVDYQIVSIIMERYLGPLKEKVLKQLTKLVKANKRSNWYLIFLTCFILLHSYEMTIVIIRKHAAKRKAPVRYIIMELVREIQAGSKIILAHFHYCCKGQIPFSAEFDWLSESIKRMAELDEQQLHFLRTYVPVVQENRDIFEAVRKSDQYEAPYWFVSQLFENDWEPRDCHEHSPPSDSAYLDGEDYVITKDGIHLSLDPLQRPDIIEDPEERPIRKF